MMKSGNDRMWWQTAFSMAAGVVGVLALPFVASPVPASWPCIAASVVIHVVYNLLLVRMYGSGEFGQTYPIARGSSPLLIALGAFLVAGEVLTPVKIAGVVLVSGGIFALGFQGRRVHLNAVPVALATGVSIALYSIVDGIGARLSGSPFGYSAWMFVLWAAVMGALYIFRYGAGNLVRSRRDIMHAAGGGTIALTGYAIVIWAMSVTQMGAVSALRETSVVFAALIARFFLNERLTVGRMTACLVIAAGGVLLGYSA